MGENLLYNTFLSEFKKKEHVNNNFNNIEFIISPICNLGCKYCYLHSFGEELYPEELFKHDKVIYHLSLMIDWLIENNMNPNIELFSGELFAQELGIQCCDLIYNKYKKQPDYLKPEKIIVPTNFTFILNKEITNKVEKIIEKFEKINISFILSASIDGKYIENNRPFNYNYRNNYYSFIPEEDRNDFYYDQVFKFARKYNVGFHPMIYSRNIEKWKDNWLWFQKMFEKHDIDFRKIYLLYVRNLEWNNQQIKSFQDFIKFLLEWTYNLFDKEEDFVNFILRNGYNILSTPFSQIGRGIGCSIQTTLGVRMGDLSVFPCHRLMYPYFKEFEFSINKERNKIEEVQFINPSLFIAEKSFHANTQPMCSNCLIKFNCIKGCLGSQYEANGEIFSPIPTVCKLNHAFIYTVAKTLNNFNLLNQVLSYTDQIKAYSIRKILELKEEF